MDSLRQKMGRQKKNQEILLKDTTLTKYLLKTDYLHNPQQTIGLERADTYLEAIIGATYQTHARAAEESVAINRRLKVFRCDKPFPDLREKTVIVVDDGLASGFSMMTTLRALRRRDVRKAVVAVPTAPMSAINLVRPHADRIVCLNIRSGPIFAVADAYKVWYDLSDGEVIDILEKHGFYAKPQL